MSEESLNISSPIKSSPTAAEAPPLKAQPGLMSVFYSQQSPTPSLLLPMCLRKQKQVKQMMFRAGAQNSAKSAQFAKNKKQNRKGGAIGAI